MRSHIVVLLLVVALPCLAARVGAQNRPQPGWGIPFDLRRDGAWRVKARRVAAERARLLSRGDFAQLNGSRVMGVSGTATALSGAMSVPLVLFYYRDTDPSAVRDPSEYSAVLFAPEPSLGRPYTLRSYFEQLSDSLFSVHGQSVGWAALDSNEVTYTGQGCNTRYGNCNGIFSADAGRRMQQGLRAALDTVDGGLDFAQFDNDGPDGIPNSGDDDGYVDLVMFATPTQDGACGGSANNHMWSHQWMLGAGDGRGDYVTNDVGVAGTQILISDYLLESGLGGSTSCDATQIMPIGTTAHVLGYALGLAPLFDRSYSSEGIGSWGLMGGGNFSSPESPSRMEAWSLLTLGWVTVVPLTATGTYAFGAAPKADTAFLVEPTGSNPRGEFFLLENRQAVSADTALIRTTCQASGQPPTCPGGLLVWHIDLAKILSVPPSDVNVGLIHGVALMQADGFNQLRYSPGDGNRGDAGDPYPGTSGNTRLSGTTNPGAVLNENGSWAGFAIDEIRQVVPGGELSFRLRFGPATVVRASDTNAVVSVNGVDVKVFRDLLTEGSTHTISVADTQFSDDARTRWRFASWSDGGARTHDFTAGTGADTIIATLSPDYQIIASAGPGGTVSASPAVNLAGEFRAKGSVLQLTAAPSLGLGFGGWSGDTTSNNPVLTLTMERPYTVTATFMMTSDVVAQLLGSGAPLSPEQLLYLDSKGNQNGVFDIGDFLAWLDASGAGIAAQKGGRP